MLKKLKNLFESFSENGDASAESDNKHDVIVAVCALFLEMGRIDDTFTDEEQEKILSILKEKYGLSGEHADALIEEADRELQESVDLWHSPG
jgi:uncharacterized tellurite resistance protein B-like protein